MSPVPAAAGHPNAALVARFYAALGRRDAETMVTCYHPKATFSDPVFTHLDAAGVAAMWRMLCERGHDLTVETSDISADATSGHAHWVATYTYTVTGRRVVNSIDAEFLFRDGLIYRHRDRFDLYRWLRQALGVRGALFGWLPAAKRATRAQAAAALAAWRAKRAG